MAEPKSDVEAEQRRDAILKRMLETPPKPHTKPQKHAPQKRKKGLASRWRRLHGNPRSRDGHFTRI
jgi:hypothetical protein